MWVVTKERKPEQDGFYLVQMMHGGLEGLSYTTDGGWNTRRYNEELMTQSAISDFNVARWFDAPQPPEVPNEWFFEAMRSLRMEVTK